MASSSNVYVPPDCWQSAPSNRAAICVPAAPNLTRSTTPRHCPLPVQPLEVSSDRSLMRRGVSYGEERRNQAAELRPSPMSSPKSATLPKLQISLPESDNDLDLMSALDSFGSVSLMPRSADVTTLSFEERSGQRAHTVDDAATFRLSTLNLTQRSVANTAAGASPTTLFAISRRSPSSESPISNAPGNRSRTATLTSNAQETVGNIPRSPKMDRLSRFQIPTMYIDSDDIGSLFQPPTLPEQEKSTTASTTSKNHTADAIAEDSDEDDLPCESPSIAFRTILAMHDTATSMDSLSFRSETSYSSASKLTGDEAVQDATLEDYYYQWPPADASSQQSLGSQGSVATAILASTGKRQVRLRTSGSLASFSDAPSSTESLLLQVNKPTEHRSTDHLKPSAASVARGSNASHDSLVYTSDAEQTGRSSPLMSAADHYRLAMSLLERRKSRKHERRAQKVRYNGPKPDAALPPLPSLSPPIHQAAIELPLPPPPPPPAGDKPTHSAPLFTATSSPDTATYRTTHPLPLLPISAVAMHPHAASRSLSEASGSTRQRACSARDAVHTQYGMTSKASPLSSPCEALPAIITLMVGDEEAVEKQEIGHSANGRQLSASPAPLSPTLSKMSPVSSRALFTAHTTGNVRRSISASSLLPESSRSVPVVALQHVQLARRQAASPVGKFDTAARMHGTPQYSLDTERRKRVQRYKDLYLGISRQQTGLQDWLRKMRYQQAGTDDAPMDGDATTAGAEQSVFADPAGHAPGQGLGDVSQPGLYMKRNSSFASSTVTATTNTTSCTHARNAAYPASVTTCHSTDYVSGREAVAGAKVDNDSSIVALFMADLDRNPFFS